MAMRRQPTLAPLNSHSPIENRRVQQREIAERAQVSVSTVSRVLNQVSGISGELKQRVLQAADELGYQVQLGPKEISPLRHLSLFAAQLSDQANLDPFHADILAGVEAECRRQGIHLSYSVVEPGPQSTAFILDKIRQANIDGLLFLALDDRNLIEQILAQHLHAVLINAEHPGLPVDTFVPSNRAGAFTAVNYLLDKGHRNIVLATDTGRRTIRDRNAGYREALEQAGLPYDPSLTLKTMLEPAEAYQTLRDFLAGPHPSFTAVFCANDGAAIGVMRAVQEAGYRIPEDVSVVGFDDIPMAAFTSPPLTTIRIERGELGVLAVRRLLEQAHQIKPTPIRVELFSRLIERSSVGLAKNPL